MTSDVMTDDEIIERFKDAFDLSIGFPESMSRMRNKLVHNLYLQGYSEEYVTKFERAGMFKSSAFGFDAKNAERIKALLGTPKSSFDEIN